MISINNAVIKTSSVLTIDVRALHKSIVPKYSLIEYRSDVVCVNMALTMNTLQLPRHSPQSADPTNVGH